MSPQINEPKALRFLVEFGELLDESKLLVNRASSSGSSAGPGYDAANRKLHAGLPTLRRLAEALPDVDSKGLEPKGMMGAWPWQGTRTVVDQMVGAITSSRRTEAMFVPAGPVLAADGLHPWVWHAAADLWEHSHHRQAVLDAYLKVEQMAKLKLEVYRTGKDLWAQAFKIEAPTADAPRLRLPLDPADREAWTSAHEGGRWYLGMAAATGFRNWAAHQLAVADEQVALEYLAALSILARRTDEATVERVS